MTPAPPKATPRGSARRRSKSKKAHIPKDGKKEKEEPSVEGTLIIHRNEPAVKYQEKMQTFATVTMHYFGRDLKLDYESFDDGKDEILIEQQHCGGNTLVIFKERLSSKSDFKFRSRRHRGYPFSLTFYINGMKDSRISTCCEYKHSVGLHLGCKSGHFGIVSVEGAFPCYKCLISEKMKQDDRRKKKKKKTKSSPKNEIPEDNVEVPVSDEGPTNVKPQRQPPTKTYPTPEVPVDGDFNSSGKSFVIILFLC